MEERFKSSLKEQHEALETLNNIDHLSMKEEYWSDDYDLRRADRLEKLGAPQNLISRLRKPPLTDIETVRKFVSSAFISDASDWDEIFEDLKWFTKNSPRDLIVPLEAIEAILANPPRKEERALAQMIACDANWVLDDLTDKGASEWLRKLAEMSREALGELAPPRQES